MGASVFETISALSFFAAYYAGDEETMKFCRLFFALVLALAMCGSAEAEYGRATVSSW